MTKARDRYQSGFDETIPGVRSAVYDLSLALYLLERFAKERGLLHEWVTLQAGRETTSWTVAQVLEIARIAFNTSIVPAVAVYERLQQNEEAADLMARALDEDSTIPERKAAALAWQQKAAALGQTLNNKAVVSRGWVSQCRRTLARRARTNKGAV